MKKKMVLLMISLGLVAAIVLPIAPRTSEAIPPKPDLFKASGFEVGSAGYVYMAALGEGIQKKFGIRLRIFILSGVNRLLAARQGMVEVAAISSDALFAMEGLYDFDTLAWGPQPIRIVGLPEESAPFSMATMGDSGLKTFEDVKNHKKILGRKLRVPYVVGNAANYVPVGAGLHVAGLTWDDVEVIKVHSSAAAFQALHDGTVDFGGIPATSPITYQLAEGPHGINWLEFPPDRPDYMKRYKEKFPLGVLRKITVGAGISKDKPKWLPLKAYPMLTSYPDKMSNDLAYWWTKAIVESYDQYKNITEAMPGAHIDKQLAMSKVFPWHDGSITYLKEIGKWTDELQAAQEKILARQKKLQTLWHDVVIEAADKKVKEKDFTNFWLKKREEQVPGFLVID
jgi:TRAP transporter TAXI family solute receptor